MNKFKKLLVWFWMLTKRLYKKPAFLLILAIVPVVILCYGLISQQESGMVTIAITCEDPSDSAAFSFASDFVDSSEVIRFVFVADLDNARKMVNDGVTDAAWIIKEDFEHALVDFIENKGGRSQLVTVVVREETVPLMLANEKLSGKLFLQLARRYFLYYYRQNAPELELLTDEQILEYYDNISINEDLFEFSYIDSSQNKNTLNYLLIPVRGILAILVVVGSMATAMFYICDNREGLFYWISGKRKPIVELGYQFVSLINIVLVVEASLFFAGIASSIFRELLCALLYIICCAYFGRLVRVVCHSEKFVSMIVPVLVVLMLIVCPIFISMPGFDVIKFLFPPTYYINATVNNMYFVYMMVYTFVLKIIYDLLCRLFRRT